MPTKEHGEAKIFCWSDSLGKWKEITHISSLTETEAAAIDEALRKIWENEDMDFTITFTAKIPNNRRRQHGLKPLRKAWKKTFRNT